METAPVPEGEPLTFNCANDKHKNLDPSTNTLRYKNIIPFPKNNTADFSPAMIIQSLVLAELSLPAGLNANPTAKFHQLCQIQPSNSKQRTRSVTSTLRGKSLSINAQMRLGKPLYWNQIRTTLELTHKNVVHVRSIFLRLVSC